MPDNTKVIMFNSQEAAQYRTDISGWVSKGGRYFGNDERTARYDGCTHRPCEDCGKPVIKDHLICPGCTSARDKKRYDALLKQVWDGTGMVYSETVDRYFSSMDEVDEYINDEGGDMEGLRLVICVPCYLPPIDEGDYGRDSLVEDGELPDEIIGAIEAFNKVVKGMKPVSWYPGNIAVLLAELKSENGRLSAEQKEWQFSAKTCHIWRPSQWVSGEIEIILTGKEN
jgi:hypothetical protein